jgi:3-hydroxyisobutyrate dehydrogenase-like beta-hydroxyacid dehydrogenase
MGPHADGRDESWLIVGHGSVGSFLAKRLERIGAEASILDGNPRVPITYGKVLPSLPHVGTFSYVISCVPPDAAEDVGPAAIAALRPGGLLFDWNTVAPAVKRRIGSASAAVVDVALLDSLDGAPEKPTLAVSGPEGERSAEVFERLGFSVSVAGDQVGVAAALKYLRSIFMKSLEALTIEFAVLASDLDHRGIVRDSIERNLGTQFVSFMDLLIATNRLHAERRSGELADAVATSVGEGVRLELAEAAVSVLRQAAEAWSGADAPPADADLGTLTDYLRRTLWPEPAST